MHRRFQGTRFLMLFAVPGFLLAASIASGKTLESDVCVFGATPGGISAAIQASRMGHSVVLVEPGRYLGGLTTGGLGATDIGNKAAIGGLSREFYHRIALYYASERAWNFESRAEYFARRSSGQSLSPDLSSVDATMWTFEPHVAERIFFQLLQEAKVPIYLGRRLKAVRKSGARIQEIRSHDGDVFRAQMFIDATYEGDLLAAAGVSFHMGREANRIYGESLNGIRAETPKHQFQVPVDPYRRAGDPRSGLLRFIQSTEDELPGEGDRRIQAYNFRLCFTTNDSNRLRLERPPHYRESDFELLARYLESLVAAGQKPQLPDFWHPIWMPNQKTDINNNGGFSTDFIGANTDYPTGSESVRRRIQEAHQDYTRGFLYFLATCPRVPENLRKEMNRWGPCRDEFPETRGWPRQLYVREARRMISDLVMTEHHCRGESTIPDSVGLAAYNMDSHNCQRRVKNGRVENEGDVQVPPMRPYSISYRSVIPRGRECENLLVPVCLAASHIAYGSIRMEPVFMILGQSTATAACLACEQGIPVQQLNYETLRTRLLADHQVLSW